LLKELSHQQALMDHSPHYQAMLALKQVVDRVLARTVVYPRRIFHGVREKLNLFCIHPLTGFPLLAAVLYFGFYKLVGQFGAGFLVDWIDSTVFESWINPWATRGIEALIPWPVMQSLFCGEYGLVTLGLRYAVAIVLPIVGMFFLMFSILEDSGYLPRLSMLMDRVFKNIGLNGRAVIPIVLGFGCDTMATLVTRTLETRRERMIATILLALTIPCSAQLGVILGLLSKNPAGLAIWGVVLAGIFMACGYGVARFLPGEKPSFYMEMPPLRWPRPQNILVKTLSRMVWYFKEILPLFLLASLLIWLGDITRIFQLLLHGLTPVVEGIGLPAEAAAAFLYGFFRRDFGAAGLYDLQHQGLLTGNQLLVASVTLTLFLPCVAQFMIMKKEQGLRFTLGVSAGVFLIAFLTGFCLNTVLNLVGMKL
ncbi:MAG: ferrous iron transporter B, partial [Lentisphaerae bacterium]|nr:ferrous iron transporter B [Lentisphaerota bacterium]